MVAGEGVPGTAHLAAGALAPLTEVYDVVLACLGDSRLPRDGDTFSEVVRVPGEALTRRARRGHRRDFDLIRKRRHGRRQDDIYKVAWRAASNGSVARRLRALPALVPWLRDGLAVRAERHLGRHTPLDDLVARVRPALVIGPHVGYESVTIDTVAAARAASVPVLLLQTGWGVFVEGPPLPEPPDFLGVWGLQSAM